jgi:hypothetical protein
MIMFWKLVILSAAAILHPHSAGMSSPALQLDVGPGVTAGAQIGNNAIECTDSARCVLDVPANTDVNVIGRSSRGPLRWTGCRQLVASNECSVRVERSTVVVTVR